jgi:membrane-associated protease RseP (regulator of RpoE activity)
MTALLYALGVVLFALGVILSIALHEVGHMWPARKFGIKVTRYFVGFGKTVWSVRRGETEYGVKIFPLGGFVQLSGMLPPEKRDPEGRALRSSGFFSRLIADARTAEYEKITAGDNGRLFYEKAWWKKVIVMAGGPMVNVLLAVVFLSGVFIGFGVPTTVPTVEHVYTCVPPAHAKTLDCTSPAQQRTPASVAGLRKGDQIVAVDGRPVTSWSALRHEIRSSAGRTLQLGIERDGASVTLRTPIVSAKQQSIDHPGKLVDAGFLGILPAVENHRKNLGYVVATMGDYTRMTGQAIVKLPQEMVGVAKAAAGIEKRDPASPMSVVGASRVAGEVASNNDVSVADRWATLLQLLGVINLFIALFNFIPLLPLDGGHIAGALYEAARRGIARLRGRPDPGYADVAKMLPVAYMMAAVLLVMGVILIWADIVNPITLQS